MLIQTKKINGEEAFISADDVYVIRKQTADGVVNEVMTLETNEYLGRIGDDELDKLREYLCVFRMRNISGDDGR